MASVTPLATRLVQVSAASAGRNNTRPKPSPTTTTTTTGVNKATMVRTTSPPQSAPSATAKTTALRTTRTPAAVATPSTEPTTPQKPTAAPTSTTPRSTTAQWTTAATTSTIAPATAAAATSTMAAAETTAASRKPLIRRFRETRSRQSRYNCVQPEESKNADTHNRKHLAQRKTYPVGESPDPRHVPRRPLRLLGLRGHSLLQAAHRCGHLPPARAHGPPGRLCKDLPHASAVHRGAALHRCCRCG